MCSEIVYTHIPPSPHPTLSPLLAITTFIEVYHRRFDAVSVWLYNLLMTYWPPEQTWVRAIFTNNISIPKPRLWQLLGYELFWITWFEFESPTSELNVFLYAIIKYRYGREKYLDNMNDAKSRKFVTQIRISAHKFPVEQGRYVNIPRKQWLCNICNCKVVGDEYPCVRKENTLKERRENFIKELLNINVNFKNFDYKTLFYYILSLNNVTSLMWLISSLETCIMESFLSKIW